MLFEAERLHFFRPLTGKYREQIAGCLRELYARLYTSLADYSRVIGRELVLEVFQEAITRTPVLDDADDDKSPPAAPLWRTLRSSMTYMRSSWRVSGSAWSRSTGCAYADSVLLPAIRMFGRRDQESR